MYDRIYNFAAGPSQLPLEVLEEIHKDLFNYKGTGMSVMEMSHRSKMYLNIFNETKDALRRVMDIPENYEILFMQGGATEQFAAIPLNLFKKNNKADYIVTGAFSKKAAKEAGKFGEVNVIYDAGPNYDHIPTLEELKFSDDADYVYLCANNTIYGTEWHNYPKTDKPLVADMSSDICSHVIDVKDFGLIYAGVQKNLGIAGLALIIIRKDLIEGHKENIPQLFEYDNELKNDSMVNTPPTFAIYVLGLMAKWIESKGGVKALEEVNKKKAQMIYDLLDEDDFYKGHARSDSRSLMNITFNLASEELEAKFVKEAKEAGMENLKGHRSVGGIRASVYNAMPIEGVEKLVAFMKDFKEKNK